MNIVLGIISIIFVYTSTILMDKFLKKEGLIIWITFATITANILVCKNIDIFNLTVSLGNIMFASNFLATDILSEKYSKDYAYKAVIIGLVMNLLFTFFMQIALLYIPSSTDISNESMKKLFNLNLRVSLSSSLLYFLSNYLDIYLFNKLKEKYPNKLWLRNNVSTIISNCLENYLFVTLSFIGIYDINTIISIATTTSIIEIFLAILDTPFLYLSKKNNT